MDQQLGQWKTAHPWIIQPASHCFEYFFCGQVLVGCSFYSVRNILCKHSVQSEVEKPDQRNCTPLSLMIPCTYLTPWKHSAFASMKTADQHYFIPCHCWFFVVVLCTWHLENIQWGVENCWSTLLHPLLPLIPFAALQTQWGHHQMWGRCAFGKKGCFGL